MKATDPQSAPTGEGTIVLGEVLAIIEDMVRIRESGATGRDAREQKNLRKVHADLEARAEMGKAKYGTYLRTNNGRDASLDLYQELLDAIMYAEQANLERKGGAGHLVHLLIFLAQQITPEG